MTRRRLAVVALTLLVAVCGVAGGILWALFQVPEFYEQALAETPDRQQRQEAAKELVQRTLQFADSVRHAPRWSEEFRQQQINSWLAEELLDPKYAELLPPDISDPRVRLDEELVRVGFRVDHDGWRGVVSLRVRPWVPRENQLAVEIQSVQVGLVPYPLDEILSQVIERIEAEGWRVQWQQADGNDVLLVHLDRGGHSDPVLESLEVVDGAIRFHGRNGKAVAANATSLAPR